MGDDRIQPLQSRTNAKLAYARVHLDELLAMPGTDGGAYDRAHQESFLFHLFGARDAFLAELNQYYGAGLGDENLTPGSLRAALSSLGKKSAELAELRNLEDDASSWYSEAKLFRDHSSHVQGVSRAFYVGGSDDGTVKLKNPRTGKETNQHFFQTFEGWLQSMSDFIAQLRKSALERHAL